MTPEFSSTIFFCPEKNGCAVGSTSRSTGSLPRLATIAPASSAVTDWYIVDCSPWTSTSGPAAHSPMQPTPLTLHLCSRPCALTSDSSADFTWSLRDERQLAATHTRTVCSSGARSEERRVGKEGR